MWKIGKIEIKNKVGLAPMAGISNPAYIKICQEMGLGYAVTELISSEAIVRGNKKTFNMLNGIESLNIPIGVQIFGSNPKTMAQAAITITNMYKNVFIDINMGCPVPKVAIRSEAGSALMKDLNKVESIVSSVVNSISVPVTVKIRSGWDNEHINAVEVAKICEKSGASAICVHPRTRSQGYSGISDWEIIKQVKDAVNIPVIGNGDIKSGNDAKRMIELTGCDAVMIGRALLGNPWLVNEIVLTLNGKYIHDKPTNIQKIDMCLKHLSYLIEFKPSKVAALEIRNHIAWYIRRIDGSAEIKNKIFRELNVQKIENILLNYKEQICEEEKI